MNIKLSFISIVIYFILVILVFFNYSFAQKNGTSIYDIEEISLDLDKNNLVDVRYSSFNVSSISTEERSWSSLHEKEIVVKEGDRYTIISNMGANSYAVQSHIVVEGFNNSTKKWEQLIQCPEGIDGPLKMQRFVCNIEIDSDIIKIRPVFRAGWSLEEGQKALTQFGELFIIRISSHLTPVVYDNNLKIQQVYNITEIEPIVLDFVDQNNILVADRIQGIVYRLTNDSLTPLLDVNVTAYSFLGLSTIKTQDKIYVFIFYREAGEAANGDDRKEKVKPKCNCLYRYELENNSLINPKLFLSIPPSVEPAHNGGVIRIGPENNVYIITGEMDESFEIVPNKVRNIINGSDPDGSSGILRFTLDGDPVQGILGDTYPLNLYYAYGIRNSFGMDFDPITGYLWDTENGDFHGDEINLVEPGFNSGHNITAGIWHSTNKSKEMNNPTGLVDFDGKGKYSSPEFSWKVPVGPISLSFYNSTKLGNSYNNTMFVSDVNNGFIYNFKLTENRTALELVGPLQDKIADKRKELSSVILASGLGVITDIRLSPDGYLYLTSYDQGKIYRIVPNNNNTTTSY